MTPLVGRVREIEALEAVIATVGRGGLIVAISGEPGIGKSRSLAELADPRVRSPALGAAAS